MPSFHLAINLIALCLFLFFARRAWIRPRPLPPGPKGWPIIGNIFDIPKEKAHIAYMEMAVKYGSDLLYLNMAGTSMLILNSVEATNDLFVGRSTLYSDRPRFPMICELMGWDYNFGFIPYGTRWRKSRALFIQLFSPSNLKTHEKPLMQESVHVFLNRLLDTPKEFEDHMRFLSGGNIISSVYGIVANDFHHPHIELTKKLSMNFRKLQYPGWIPGARFKRKAADERKTVEEMIRQPLEFVKRNIASGTAKPSMASRALQQMQDDGSWSEDKENLLMNALGSIYAAGADTTSTATSTIFLALVCNPDILKKGQAAVDAVVGGHDRLPDLVDEGKIPYVDAIVMEGLRWRPVIPLGIAHHTASADIYKGYYIPADTIVMGNTWAILHDPATYGEDVDQFRPERFLNPDGTLNSTIPYPDAAFGYGRRICPGRVFAHSAVWLTVASLLACFDLSKVSDKDGVAIEPSTDSVDGFFSYPRPYECNITPRSKSIEKMIRQSVS
ncbi:cytochrome P450 [Gymnopus androsaceus JB14]|uniref:Cytochrome P450 n=1 Tax=Gymnopus androsaceus JB14 TaxID=1447944 RepID=A0A6A4HQ67_9AGAR|nr:cytochrome P450 [Gymnopus androsaceus JB14]